MLSETARFDHFINKHFTFSDSLLRLLPATCDRFLEARFFARQAVIHLPATPQNEFVKQTGSSVLIWLP